MGWKRIKKKAYEYYLLSQEEGNKDAYYNIALLYYYGKGVCQDFFFSFESFERVLESGFDVDCSYVLVEPDSLTDQEKKKIPLSLKELYIVKHTFILSS
jgi:hypothetical protein